MRAHRIFDILFWIAVGVVVGVVAVELRDRWTQPDPLRMDVEIDHSGHPRMR